MSAPAYLGNPHDDPIWQELADELDRAMSKHGPMASPHEGWAVIREELEPELWEHVVGDTGRSPEARHEALQVAAMALRYIVDLCRPLIQDDVIAKDGVQNEPYVDNDDPLGNQGR